MVSRYVLVSYTAPQYGVGERKCVFCVCCGVCLRVSMRGMPPQPHPPVAEGAWLRPRPARQSPDCRRGRVHRHASRHPKRVRRSPLRSLRFARALDCFAICAAPLRKLRFLRCISGGGIPRPAHSVSAEPRCGWRCGAPPATARPSGVRRVIRSPDTARSAWGRIQPSSASQPFRRRLPRPAVRACSASCRRPSSPLRTSMARGVNG